MTTPSGQGLAQSILFRGVGCNWVSGEGSPQSASQTSRHPHKQGCSRKSRGFQTKCHRAISQREIIQSVETTMAHIYLAPTVSTQMDLCWALFPLHLWHIIPVTVMIHLWFHSSVNMYNTSVNARPLLHSLFYCPSFTDEETKPREVNCMRSSCP